MNRVHKRRRALSHSQARVYPYDAPLFTPIYQNEPFDENLIVEPPGVERKDVSFHVSILPVATFVQFLALMPVCGISQRDPKFLTFKWKSMRTIYTLAYILYGVIVSIFFFTFILKEGISAKNMVGVVFFTYTTICVIIFLMIATNWPAFMQEYHEKEQRFLSHPYKPHGWKLSSKIRITAAVVIFLAFTEHLIFLANSTFNQYKYAASVNETIDISYFLEHQFHFIFSRIKFNLAFGFFVEIMNLSFTFGWNYMELFTMMISLALKTRFDQINDRLDTMKGKIYAETVWIDIREDYVRVCEMMERVDHELGFLILLSNLNNLYFICFQLLNIYDSLPYTINYVYFWFSLIYLFGRTLTAQFLAAMIHDSSNYPLDILTAVPDEGWCIEVQRMIDQIRAQTMALSGCKFFFITRKMILAMLTMIVTYELVLMQFDSDPNEQVDRILNE